MLAESDLAVGDRPVELIRAELYERAELARQVAQLAVARADGAVGPSLEIIEEMLAGLREFTADAMAMGEATAEAYNAVLESTGDPERAKAAGREALERTYDRIDAKHGRELAAIEASLGVWGARRSDPLATCAPQSGAARNRESRTRRRSSDTQPAANGSRGSPYRPPPADEPHLAGAKRPSLPSPERRRALNRELVRLGRGQVEFSNSVRDAVRAAIAAYWDSADKEWRAAEWFEQHPTLNTSRPCERRKWSGSRLFREVVLFRPELYWAAVDDDELPPKGTPEQIVVGNPSNPRSGRASKPPRTRCCRCRREFTDPATRGKSADSNRCRACDAARKAEQREQKRRERAKLEGRAPNGWS